MMKVCLITKCEGIRYVITAEKKNCLSGKAADCPLVISLATLRFSIKVSISRLSVSSQLSEPVLCLYYEK